jgi:GH24 family phage-related lysozyme (muramidase)
MTAIRLDIGELKGMCTRLEMEVLAPMETACQRVGRTECLLVHDRNRYGDAESRIRQCINAALLAFLPRRRSLEGVEDRLRTAIRCFESVDQVSSERWSRAGRLFAACSADPRVRILSTFETADFLLADYFRYGGLCELECAATGGFWLWRCCGTERISDAGLRFIGRKEGFVDHLYDCPANCCTIGYGHKVHNGPTDGRASEAPYRDGITRTEALALLREDAASAEESVRKYVTVPLTQGQYDALVSFVFNLGEGYLRRPEILGPLNNGDFEAVAAQMREYHKARNRDGELVPMQGLIDRRNEEADMLLAGIYPDYLDES